MQVITITGSTGQVSYHRKSHSHAVLVWMSVSEEGRGWVDVCVGGGEGGGRGLFVCLLCQTIKELRLRLHANINNIISNRQVSYISMTRRQREIVHNCKY